MKNTLKIALPSLVLALSACGGSDDSVPDTSGGIPAEFNDTPVSITTDNAEDVSSVAITSSFNNMALGVADGFTGVVVDKTEQRFNITDSQWLLSQLKKLPQVNDSFTGIVSTESDDCLYGGSTDFTFSFQDPTGFSISANDYVKFQSNNCDDGYGETNGSFTIVYTQVVDFIDYDDFTTLSFDVSFTNYSVAFSSAEQLEINGAYSLEINKDLYTEATDVTSDLLAIHIPSYQNTVENLTINKLYVANTGIETLSTSSKISDDLIGGSVTVSTVEEFVFPYRYSFTPTSGVMKVIGADNSSVLLTVSGGVVQIDADFNGDNTIDETTTTTWSELNF